jgi:adenosylmethionine-8-amino-7-oxononanoate aminotransferase
MTSRQRTAELVSPGRRHQWLALGFDESYFDGEPLVVTRGEGARFVDAEGDVYVDALCGQSAAVIGHNHPRVVEAMREQLSRMTCNVGGLLPSDQSIELAERLSQLSGGELARTFYCTGGSDANDTAIKLARQYWKNMGRASKFKTVVRRHGYHGGTLATNAASGNTRYPHSAFEPLPGGFVHIESPYRYRCRFCRDADGCTLECAEELRRSLEYEDPETVACFLAEPTMAAGGIIPPPPGYLDRVREICDEHDVLLVLDEVVTAMGRAGEWFEHQLEGVVPDVLVLAKGLTGGHVPLGALVVREEVAAAFQGPDERRFLAGFTLAGTPLACAAALATIDAIADEDLIARGRELSVAAERRLLELQDRSPIVGDVRVRGVMMGIEWVADRATRRPFASPQEVKRRAVELGHERGVHFFGGPPSVLEWIPPLNIDDAAMDQLLTTVEQVVAGIEQEFQD